MVLVEFFAVMMMNLGSFAQFLGVLGIPRKTFDMVVFSFFFLLFSPRLGGPRGMVTICLLLGGVRVFVRDKNKFDRNSHE